MENLKLLNSAVKAIKMGIYYIPKEIMTDQEILPSVCIVYNQNEQKY